MRCFEFNAFRAIAQISRFYLQKTNSFKILKQFLSFFKSAIKNVSLNCDELLMNNNSCGLDLAELQNHNKLKDVGKLSLKKLSIEKWGIMQ
jgi:hypothetical protein